MLHVYEVGPAELVDGLVQRLDAEVGFQRVRDAPRQHLAGEPVHDGDQMEEAAMHGQAGDVGAPDLSGPLYPRPQAALCARPSRLPAQHAP